MRPSCPPPCLTSLPALLPPSLPLLRPAGVRPQMGVDPAEAVALGAAIHAGVLLGQVNGVELMDGRWVAECVHGWGLTPVAAPRGAALLRVTAAW